MNYIFITGGYTVCACVANGNYNAEDANKTDPIVQITNWPFDILSVNEENCIVFTDPNLISDQGAGFTNNGVLAPTTKVMHGHDLFNYDGSELRRVITLPMPYVNLSERLWIGAGFPAGARTKLITSINESMDIPDCEVYVKDRFAAITKDLIKEGIPVRHLYAINHATGYNTRCFGARLGGTKHVFKDVE